MSATSISVVIPTHNCERWITDAVDSAFAQTLRPNQIVVVDDGSTDDTLHRLKRYRERGLEYVAQENQGVSAARNAGIGRVTSDLVAFLDADDVWHPRKLELQHAVLCARPDLGIVGTERFSWPGIVPEGLPSWNSPGVREIRWDDLAVKNYLTTSSVIIRRSALEGVGPTTFDTSLQGPEDYDLWLRVAKAWKVAILELPLAGYRSSPAGLGNQPKSMEAGMGRILEKLDRGRAWDDCGDRFVRRKAYAYFHFSCALMYGAAGRHKVSLLKVVRSMLTYPMPFRPEEARVSLARPKLFGVSALRLLGIKGPHKAP